MNNVSDDLERNKLAASMNLDYNNYCNAYQITKHQITLFLLLTKGLKLLKSEGQK